MQTTNHIQAKVYFACLLTGILVIVYSHFEKERLNRTFRADQKLMLSLAGRSHSEEGVQKVLAELASRQPDSHVILREHGRALAATGDYSSAANAYRKALKLNPFYVEDFTFLQEAGLYLYQSGQFSAAKAFWELAATRTHSETQKTELNALIEGMKKREQDVE